MPGQVKKSLQKELHNKLMENRCMAGHRVCNKVDERLVHEVRAMSVMRFHPRACRMLVHSRFVEVTRLHTILHRKSRFSMVRLVARTRLP